MRSSRTSLLMSTFSGMFLWGILASIAPLSQSWPFTANISGFYTVLLVLTGPILALLGNVSMGFVSDWIGRKKVFILTMALYIVGIAIISFSFSVVTLLAGIALSEFGIAGEEIPTIALLAEDTPRKKMSSLITNGMNFSNVGGTFIAGMLILVNVSNSSLLFQRLAILIPSIFLIGIMVYARMSLPESYRWLDSRGRKEEAEKEVSDLGLETDFQGESPARKISPGLSYLVLTFLALSQYLTFGLMVYIVPYYEFRSDVVDILVFFGLLGSSIAGPIAARLISRGRKNYSVFAYAGGFLTVLAILMVVNDLQNLLVFVPLLFLNMAFSEFAWASRTTLEPELFSTRNRGKAIGLVRLVPMAAYPVTIYLFANFSLQQQILSNVVLWGIGLIGAIIWFLAGIETKNLDLDFQVKKA